MWMYAQGKPLFLWPLTNLRTHLVQEPVLAAQARAALSAAKQFMTRRPGCATAHKIQIEAIDSSGRLGPVQGGAVVLPCQMRGMAGLFSLDQVGGVHVCGRQEWRQVATCIELFMFQCRPYGNGGWEFSCVKGPVPCSSQEKVIQARKQFPHIPNLI